MTPSVIIRSLGMLVGWLAITLMAAAENPILIGTTPMPKVIIDNEVVKIHTQGLFVTATDFFVTGRVDTPPRRPIFLQIPRRSPSNYRVLTLNIDPRLDHPGGFDRDSDGVFWIPVSTSHRRGPTRVVGVRLVDGNLPSDASEIETKLSIADHIGAIGCLPDGRLLGANWDTRKIYVIRCDDGEIDSVLDHPDFFGDSEIRNLAVQDWKYDSDSKQIIAGGIDKSSRKVPANSRAVVVRVDPIEHRVISILRFDRRKDVATALTNEGLAWFGDQLFLLPEDFRESADHHAKVLQFELR